MAIKRQNTILIVGLIMANEALPNVDTMLLHSPQSTEQLALEKIPVYASYLKKNIASLKAYLRQVEYMIEKQLARDRKEENYCKAWRKTMSDRIDTLEKSIEVFGAFSNERVHTHDHLIMLITSVNILTASFEQSIRKGFHTPFYRIPGSAGLANCEEFLENEPEVRWQFQAAQKAIELEFDQQANVTSSFKKRPNIEAFILHDPYLRLIHSIFLTSSTAIPRAIETYRKNIANIWISDIDKALSNSYIKILYEENTFLPMLPVLSVAGFLWQSGIIGTAIGRTPQIITEVIAGAAQQLGGQGLTLFCSFAKRNLLKIGKAGLKKAEGYPAKSQVIYGFQQVVKSDQLCIISPECSLIIDNFNGLLEAIQKGTYIPNRSFCLTGDPGVGKTYQLKQYILPEIDQKAKEAGFAGAYAMEITADLLKEGEQALAFLQQTGDLLFKQHNLFAIYYCDELATYALHTGGNEGNSRLLLEFLNNLPEGSMFIGATNAPEQIRPDMFRPGRFSKIHLQLPTVSDITQALIQKCAFYKTKLHSQGATAIAALMKNGPQSTMAAIDAVLQPLLTCSKNGAISAEALREHEKALLGKILETSHSVRPLSYNNLCKNKPELAQLQASLVTGQLFWHYTEAKPHIKENIWKHAEQTVKSAEIAIRDHIKSPAPTTNSTLANITEPFFLVATLNKKIEMVPIEATDTKKGHKEQESSSLCLAITAHGAKTNASTFNDALSHGLSTLAGIIMQETHNNNYESSTKTAIIDNTRRLFTDTILDSINLESLPHDLKEDAKREALYVLHNVMTAYKEYANRPAVRKAAQLIQQRINPTAPIITSDDIAAIERSSDECREALQQTHSRKTVMTQLVAAADRIKKQTLEQRTIIASS